MAQEEEPILLEDDEDPEDASREQRTKKSGSTEIPNFRGKAIEADTPENKGPLQVQWTEDDEVEDSEEEESEGEEDEEKEEDGDVEAARAERRKERRRAKAEEEEEEVLEEEEIWDFPRDDEGWEEKDLGEEWADPTPADDTVGRDPDLAEDDEELIAKLEKEGCAPPRRPYYVPYRKAYPPIPDDHPDIETPQDVVEELERMEEFLVWASYVFADGSSYEGTVWDDLAHGRGVYTTPLELCKYEGEWFQNMMEGHGVLEVDVPTMNPPPDSELEKKMREEGHILAADFMPPEDREWLKMDIEDTFETYPEAVKTVPFEDDELWVKYYGQKPEKGHYKYAGQWKHSRMHGCGVYSLNGRQIWGKFYFGDLLPDEEECTSEMSAIHASLAEVAAAKARMFVNKPDGMVREVKGPYNDPQHPYMYEEEDLWMAPGFINAYYKIPEVWQKYVFEVDQEQEMWLNSFIKSPLRIPMPAELEHQWAKGDEFVVLANDPTSALWYDPENLERAKDRNRGEVLLHVPTGQIINWATDPDGNVRLFLQPIREDGKVVPEDAIPLPLGFKEFMGEAEEGEGEGVPEEKLTDKEKLLKKWEEEDRQRREKWKREDEERARRYLQEDAEFLEKVFEETEEDKLKILAEEEKFQIQLADDEDTALPATAEAGDSPNSGGDQADATASSDDNSAKRPPTAEAQVEQGEEEEDEDEDEDQGKPRSFGKVAFVDPELMEAKPTRGHGNQDVAPRVPPFPSVFASLSLLPQVAFRPVLYSVFGPTLRILKDRINFVFRPDWKLAPSDQARQVTTEEAETSLSALPAVQKRSVDSVGYRLSMVALSKQAAGRLRAESALLPSGPPKNPQKHLHRRIPASAWALSGMRSYQGEQRHRRLKFFSKTGKNIKPTTPSSWLACQGVDELCDDASILSIAVPLVQG